jgi:hypothetical protein
MPRWFATSDRPIKSDCATDDILDRCGHSFGKRAVNLFELLANVRADTADSF